MFGLYRNGIGVILCAAVDQGVVGPSKTSLLPMGMLVTRCETRIREVLTIMLSSGWRKVLDDS
jgi:hypothetical protein